MTNPVIPAEAVEAAAKALYHDGWDGPPYWESLADDNSDKVRGLWAAQKALEAAAPYMPATPATVAMGGILKTLDQWFNNKTSPDQALNTIAQISGAYKTEEGL